MLAAIFAGSALQRLTCGAFAFWRATLSAIALFDQVLKLVRDRQSSAIRAFHDWIPLLVTAE
jgi:hypothetical protein